MPNKELKASVSLDITKAERALSKLETRISNINSLVNKQTSSIGAVTRGLNNASNSASNLNKNIKKTGDSVGVLTKKVKALASAYLGVMGARAVITTSDSITRAENQLNNLPNGSPERTQSTLDKIYAAAQRSRSDYTGMVSNVGKLMTLSPDAFQHNEDNAIRFQEIMAKSYALGNKSDAEQASSMYQLVQALGSGVLQGDELKSVREGASLAYQEIENFAQAVFDTEKSLKDLASEGVITSDIVVAAIMNAEGRINEAFKNTKYTFSDVTKSIKSSATKAFEPVLQKLNDGLNRLIQSGALTVIENIFIALGNAISRVFDLFDSFTKWFADNWYWLQWIVYSVIIAMVVALGIFIGKSIAAGIIAFASFIMGLSPLYLWIIVIGIVIAYLAYMANQTNSVCEFIYQVAMVLAYGILGFLAVILLAYLATGAVMISVPMMIALFIIGVILVVVAAFVKYTGQIVGFTYGMKEAFLAIWENIKLAFQNILNTMKYLFWNWVDGLIQDFKPFLEMVNAVLEAMDKKTINLDYAGNRADELAQEIGFVSVKDAFSRGYSEGYSIGEGIQDNINSWSEKIKGIGSKFSLDNLLENKLPGANDQRYGVSGAYDPTGANDDIANGLKKIGDDTGSIAESMDLTQEDMEYLRRIADMEWKKEFTTANITVDMSNYNTINGDSDLDGIVSKLSDKLREEMNILADGVYAY